MTVVVAAALLGAALTLITLPSLSRVPQPILSPEGRERLALLADRLTDER